MSPEIHVRVADWETEQQTIKHLRRTVFIEEQGVPEELEWDGRDAECTQWLATLETDVAGTTRLTPEGQIGRMAVLKPYRHKGIASALLQAAIDHADHAGMHRVFLHSQVEVIGLYEKFGFTSEGGIFLDAGIKHQAMYKLIR